MYNYRRELSCIGPNAKIHSIIIMSDLFSPYINDSIRDTGISTSYSKRVIDNIDVPHTTKRHDYLGTSISRLKIMVLMLGVVVGLVILIGRLFFLQVMHGADYREI